MQEAQ
jgi:hypothetical protein